MHIERRFVGIAGYPGTGKTALSNHLVRDHGFQLFEGSAALEAEAAKRGIVFANRAEFGAFHGQLQKERGTDVLLQMMLEIEEDDLVFSGIRSVANAKGLKKVGGIIFGLQCPPDVAWTRMDSDSHKTPATFEGYLAQMVGDNKPEFGIGTDVVMDMADYRFNTIKSLRVTSMEADRALADRWPHQL